MKAIGAGLVVLVVSAAAGLAEAGGAEAIRFVVLGDRTGSLEAGALEAAAVQAKALEPDVVVSVGDFIEGYTEDRGELGRQWEEVDAALAPLGAAVHYCPGNHDVPNETDRKFMLERHPTPTGQTWYSFDLRGCHFIILDPTTFDTAKETQAAQLAFLDGDLATAASARHTFIFMHQPNWDGELFKRVKAKLDPARTTLFSGHTHRAAFVRRQGFDWYVLPPTATRSANAAALGDFRAVTLVELGGGSDAKPVVQFVTEEGARVPGDYLPEKVLQQRQSAVQGFDVKIAPGAEGAWLAEVVQPNPTEQRLSVALWWLDRDVENLEGLEVVPGGKATQALGEVSLEPHRPVLMRRYDFAVPVGMSGAVETGYTLPRVLHAQRIGEVTVDGDTSDWPADTPAAIVDQRDDVRTDVFAWDGPADLSFTVRAGITPAQLALAISVRDDMVEREASGSAWHSDAVLLTIPQTAAAGAITAMIVIPPRGGQPEISWFEPNGGPAGAQAVVKRTTDGYVLEMALSFESLGYPQPPKKGDVLRLDLALRDRDKVTGLGPITQMWLSGGYNEVAPAGGPAMVVCE